MGQPASPLCGSVWGEGSERGHCHCLSSGGLPSTRPVSSHFTYSPYVTGALPAVALVVNSRGTRSACILSPCRLFNQGLLEIRQFLLPPQPPLVFTTRSYEDLSSWHWNPGLCALAWGWDCLLPRYPCPFYPPHVNVGPPVPLPLLTAPDCFSPSAPISASLPLLSIWMDVVSLNPWLSDFHTARFSDGSRCYLFRGLIVILSLIVQVGKACLPTPPSWLEVCKVVNL